MSEFKAHHRHSPDNCTTCTTCTAYCPVAAVTRKFHGPKMTGPAFERFRLLHQTDEDALSFCSNCKSCDISCPSGVPISTLNMLARADYAKIKKPSLKEWFPSHGEFIHRYIGWLPSWLLNFGMNNPVTRFVLHAIGIHREAPLPNFTKTTFKKLYKKMDHGKKNKKTIAFFPGCFINIYLPQIGIDLVEVLVKAGYHVIVPDEFVCCGVPLISNGFANEAERQATQNSNELARWARLGIPVLASCPSCALMLKQEYKDLFPNIENAGRNASDVVDACEFIGNLIDSGEWKPEFKDSAEIKGIYHAPCHLRAQGMGRTGLELLKRIPNTSVADADAGCCGISGSYGFKKDKYQISMDIGAPLFKKIDESDASYVLTECGTCQVQIKHGIDKSKGRKVIHPITMLRRRLKD